jgi:TP901 family phage tail tape measure protein
MDQLKVSAEAASMTGANLDDTTYALSSVMASGITGAKNYADMMGVLNGIVGAGDMRFQDLNGAISTGFIPTAAQFGISIQSLGAALSTLTDNGEGAEEAATRLRMSIALMSAPTAQAAKVLGALGLTGPQVKASTSAATQALQDAHVTTTQLAEDLRKPDGLNVALIDLKTHLENSGLSADAADAALSKAFGGGRSDAAILTLLHNTERTGEAFDQINKTSKSFGDDWNAQQETFKQKFADAWGSIQASLTRLGNSVLPGASQAFSRLADQVNGLVTWFTKLSPQHQQMLIQFAAYAAVIGPALMLLGGVAKGISNIIGLFNLLAGPTMALVKAAYTGAMATMGVETTTLRGTIMAMQATAAAPIAVVIVIAAALAAIALVMSKLQELQGAMNGLAQARSQFNSQSSALAAAAAKLPNGPEKQKALAIANSPMPSDNSQSGITGFLSTAYNAYFHASGGVFTQPHMGVVAEDGPEAIIPLNNPGRAAQIMREAGIGGKTQNVTIGQVVLSSPAAVAAFFTQLDQDATNLSHGLTPARGLS